MTHKHRLDRATDRLSRRSRQAVAAALVLALICGAGPDSSDRLAANRRKIEGMSQSELNRLKRNYETYRQLSPERREDMQRLHDELAQDAKNHGRLQALLDGYNRWFSSLSLFDREALLAITDPAERALQVQKLREEQKKERQAKAHVEAFPALSVRGAHFADGRMLLNPAGLERVVNAVESQFLDEESKQSLPKLSTGRKRHLAILEAAMKQVQRRRREGGEGGKASNDLIAVMSHAVPAGNIKTRVEGAPRAMGQVIRRSLLAEWRSELEAKLPTQDQLDTFMEKWRATLPPAQQEKLDERIKKQPDEVRRLATVEIALATNPELTQLRPVVNWFIRGLVEPRRPGMRRFWGEQTAPRRKSTDQAAGVKPGL